MLRLSPIPMLYSVHLEECLFLKGECTFSMPAIIKCYAKINPFRDSIKGEIEEQRHWKCKRFVSFVLVHDKKCIKDSLKINRKKSHKIISFFPKSHSLKVSKSCQHSKAVSCRGWSIPVVFIPHYSFLLLSMDASKGWKETSPPTGLLFYRALLRTNHFVRPIRDSISPI